MIVDAATAELLVTARRVDPDRTLCALLAPPAARAELLALILLDHELARVAGIVRQPLTGLVRLRFWRDQLASAAAGERPDHELARVLSGSLRDGRLSLDELEPLIEARLRELDGLLEPGTAPADPPPTLEAVVAHLRATSGGLARAMARLLRAPAGELAAAEEAGAAWGLVGIVRATLLEARRHRRLAGRSLFDLAGVRPGELADETARDRLRSLGGQLLERASASIATVRRAGRAVERARLAPLLLATVAEIRLRQLRRVGCDPLRAPEDGRSPLLPVRLVLAWLRARP